jgi:hypothetical protein
MCAVAHVRQVVTQPSSALQAADKLEHVATEHFWMSGMYWGLTAMALMGRLQDMDTDKVLDWVRDSCCLWAHGLCLVMGLQVQQSERRHLMY